MDIYNSTIPSRQVTADLEPVSVDSRAAWFHAHDAARRPLWVIDGDGQIDAWLSFSDFYGRPAYSHTAELSVYVHHACRGRGIGSFLLQEAVHAAPALGIEVLVGFIFEHNRPSLGLFRRAGFTRWGRMPHVAMLDGRRRTLFIVGRRVAVWGDRDSARGC